MNFNSTDLGCIIFLTAQWRMVSRAEGEIRGSRGQRAKSSGNTWRRTSWNITKQQNRECFYFPFTNLIFSWYGGGAVRSKTSCMALTDALMVCCELCTAVTQRMCQLHDCSCVFDWPSTFQKKRRRRKKKTFSATESGIAFQCSKKSRKLLKEFNDIGTKISDYFHIFSRNRAQLCLNKRSTAVTSKHLKRKHRFRL